jgi:hypothetical protein
MVTNCKLSNSTQPAANTLKFKISMFLPAKQFTIFIPTAHNKKKIVLKIFDIPRFAQHRPFQGGG